MDFLDRLKQKPREVKDRYAILAALIITGVIGSIWLFSLPARFTDFTENAENANAGAPSALSGFLNTIESQVGSAVESFSKEEQGIEGESEIRTTDVPEAEEGTRDDEVYMGIEEGLSEDGVTQGTSTMATSSFNTASSSTPSSTVRTILIGTTTSTKTD